jgi:hypothetical protein
MQFCCGNCAFIRAVCELVKMESTDTIQTAYNQIKFFYGSNSNQTKSRIVLIFRSDDFFPKYRVCEPALRTHFYSQPVVSQLG